MSLQQHLVARRQRDEIPDQLLLLEHPPVITLGRGGKVANLLATEDALRRSGVRFFETTRGGDITYHGPGQLVGYPILHLGENNRDVRKYVWKLEEILIHTVAEYGLVAERVEGRRGIWVGNDKIAAIGVRIARWVTSHGWALNVATNLDHFRLITPCGLQGTGVTSIERETGRAVDLEDVREVLATKFAEVFERDLVPRDEDLRLVKVVAHDRDRVLLLHRTPECGDFWQPVTGSIEAGETPLDTARRELAEETGLRADVRPLGITQSFLIEAMNVIASEVAFTAAVDSSIPIKIDPDEHDAWGWFPFEEAYEKIRWTDDREALERLERALRARFSVVDSQLSAPSRSGDAAQTTDNRQPTTPSTQFSAPSRPGGVAQTTDNRQPTTQS